jgi:hypothetical protein
MNYDVHDCTNCGALKEEGATKNNSKPTKTRITVCFLLIILCSKMMINKNESASAFRSNSIIWVLNHLNIQ